MIKIETVTIKQNKKGEDYKNLKLSNGEYVNMWADDIDYSIAENGAELDRNTIKKGEWTNLLPKGEKAPEQKEFNETILKLNLLYEAVKQIQEKLGIDSTQNKVDNKMKEVEKEDDTLPLDENGDIDPNLIPF